MIMPISLIPKETGRVHVHTLSDKFLEELRLVVALTRHGRDIEAEIKIQDALVAEIPDDAEMRDFVFTQYTEILATVRMVAE